MVALAALLVLFIPKTDEAGGCKSLLPFAAGAAKWLSCDSHAIVAGSRDWRSFFSGENPFISRPLYVLAGGGVGYALAPVASAAKAAFEAGFGKIADKWVRKTFHQRFAFLALNFLFMGWVIWLAVRLFNADGQGLRLGIAAALLFNPTSQRALWVVHAEVMNVGLPIAILAAFMIGSRCADCAISAVARRMGALGALALVYPGFILSAPGFLAGVAAGGALYGAGWRVRATLAGLFAAAAPVAAWMLWCELILDVPPFATEALQYRQFLWIFDALEQGELVSAFIAKAETFWRAQSYYFGWRIFPGLALIAAGVRLTRSVTGAWRDPVFVGLLVAILGIVSFNFLQGYYQPRLTVSIVTAAALAGARLIQLRSQGMAGAALIATALGFLVEGFLIGQPNAATG